MPNANNETISLKDIPMVPNLSHASSIITDKPSQERRLLDASSGDGVSAYPFMNLNSRNNFLC